MTVESCKLKCGSRALKFYNYCKPCWIVESWLSDAKAHGFNKAAHLGKNLEYMHVVLSCFESKMKHFEKNTSKSDYKGVVKLKGIIEKVIKELKERRLNEMLGR